MLNKNTYAMNKITGECFQICTDTVLTRNRRSVRDMRLYKSKTKALAASRLVPLTHFEASICYEAEKILRGKKAMDQFEMTIVALHRELKNRIIEA